MNNPVKKTIAADIVVLVDVSSSMATNVDAIRSAWVSFVGQLLDHATTDGPRVDLRLKVVGYAMSEDGSRPVIQNNPFVRNDIDAFEMQFENLQTKPTNHKPRPLLDALWQIGCMSEIVPGSHDGTADKWRVCWNRIVSVYTDSFCQASTHTPQAGGATLDDLYHLLARARIRLQIHAPSHQYYDLLNRLPNASFTETSIYPFAEAVPKGLQIAAQLLLKTHAQGCSPRPPPSRPRCAVRETAHGCEMWTEGDVGHNVFTHLETQGFLLDGPIPDPSGRYAITRVRHSAGPNLDAANLRGYLRDSRDWEFIEFGELQQQEAT